MITTNSNSSAPRGNYRWWCIGSFLLVITAINYLDRQAFPNLVSVLEQQFSLSKEDFANLNSCFLVAYALMYLGGGWLVDKLGTRIGYTIVALFWSAACMSHAWAWSFASLAVLRFLLGFGEGGGFPSSAKVAAEWFPAKERGNVIGLFNTGSAIGLIAAPPLVGAINERYGWRAVFILFGAIGVVWSLLWFAIYRPAAVCPQIGTAEKEFLLANGVGAVVKAEPPPSWFSLFAHKELLTLAAAKFLMDGAWYFIIFWLPKFLNDAHGLDVKQAAWPLTIAYACAGIGSFAGGWLSSALVGKMDVGQARKTALTVSVLLFPTALLMAFADLPVWGAVTVMGLLYLGHQSCSVNMQTLPTDIFPARAVGSVSGIVGSAGAIGGAVFQFIFARLIEGSDYTVPFCVIAVLHPVALGLILLLMRKIVPVHL